MNPPRDATDAERSLSAALIGGAFGFIGIAIFASASYADKVAPTALWWGNFLSTLSILLFLASVMSGGRGWISASGAGPSHPFNIQAITGLAGLVLLIVAATVLAFNPREDESDAERARIEKRLDALETWQAETRAQESCRRGGASCAPHVPD